MKDTIWKVLTTALISGLLSLNLFIINEFKKDIQGAQTNIVDKVSGVDTKLFTHLTNHDIHVPREQIVSTAQWDLHTKLDAQGTATILEQLNDIKSQLREYEGKYASTNRGTSK